MSFQDCLDTIKRAAGRELSDGELDDLISELQRRQRSKMLANEVDNLEAAARSAADDYARDIAEAALIEKRNAAINLKRRLEVLDFVKSQFKDNPALGLEAALVGVNRAGQGTRRSAAAEQSQLRNYYLGGFTADLETKGLWKALVSGELDRDISRALWARNRRDPLPANVPDEAIQIADVIAKWQEVSRLDLNKAGGWVKQMPGYIVRQSHDMFKIQRAGYAAWRDAILPRLDAARTFDGADPEKFLQGVYRGLSSGEHLRSMDSAPSGFKGPANIAKKASQERVLHFKTGDDWFDYNQQFGTGNLREALMRGFDMNAQTTGLMRRMGTNPSSNLAQVVDELKAGIEDPIALSRFSEAADGRTAHHMAAIDGTTRTPVHMMGARISSGLRIQQNMAKLGGALLSQFADLPIYAMEMRYQGRTMLGGLADGVGALFKGRNRKEMAELDGMLGVTMDGMIGDVTAKFSLADDALPGALTRAQQFFFKINGMTWWTDTLRASAARSMAHRLAFHRGSDFAQLPSDVQRVLGLYGIDDARWSIIRQAPVKEADGRMYVTPESVNAVPDAVYAKALQDAGQKASPTRIADLKRDVADQLRTYLVDRASYAVTEPDARTRSFMQRGTRPGTVEGEFLRFIGQFKSFPTAVIQKQLGREVYGRGSNTLAEALRNGNGEMAGVAQLILWTTAFGYIAMSSKDLAKGRTPRDPSDPKTWAGAMVQGGGMGIYGDFLFGEMKSRFGGGVLTTLAGPVLGGVQDIADLFGRIKGGDDSAAAAFRTLISQTPFANLFYTRIALDYLILWHIQEWLNPGAMKRMESRIEKENAQTFLIRPSEVVR